MRHLLQRRSTRSISTCLSLLLALALITGCDGCQNGQAPSAAANAKAAVMKKDSVQPRLEAVAAAHPDQAAKVKAILDGWDTRPERDTFNDVKPLMDTYKLDHPDEADAVDRVMRSWQRRLDNFDPRPGVASLAPYA